MIAHIYFSIAAFSCKRTDTDVIMLCMYHFCRLSLSGSWVEKSKYFLPIHTLVDSYTKV